MSPPPLPAIPNVDPARIQPPRIPLRTRLIVVVLAAVLYALACALRAMSLSNGDHWSGFQVAWMGWMGVFFGQFAYFAHAPAFGALVTLLIGLRRTTIVLSGLAVLIGAHMFAFPGTEVMLDEGGVNKATIVSLEPGAWLWLASMLTPGLGALLARAKTKPAVTTLAAILGFLFLAAPVQAAESFKVGAFAFNVPEGWTKVQPSSPMRNAQLEVAAGPAKAEITFFHFGGGSGTAKDNVARWFSQFPGSEEQQKTEVIEAGKTKVTFAFTEGTFSSGMPGGPTTPMSGYALCGAILESPAGDVYVKMTGPEAVVKGATEAFKRLVLEAAKATQPGA